MVAVPPRDDGLSDPGCGVFNQVVVPTDGTAIAERAATHSLRVAERYGADVRVVYVVDTTIHELPYEDGSFPFVLTWNVLQHVPRPVERTYELSKQGSFTATGNHLMLSTDTTDPVR